MKALTHITVGRTAIRALLIVVVLTGGIAGSVGTVAATPMDGKGNDVYPPPGVYASLDGKGNDVPTLPPTLYESRMVGVTEGTGNDATIHAFPINNVTVFTATYVGRGGGSGKPSF